MSDEFRPSAAAARDALGEKIEEREHPGGAKGAALSLTEVAKKIREGRNDPRVRAWAGECLVAGGKPKEPFDQAQCLLDALRKQTMYAPDPVGTEMIVAAKNTLCLDNHGLCVRVADCFPRGTLLLRDDFELVPVEEIRVGDRIWGKDKWTTVEAAVFKGRLTLWGVAMNNGSVVQLTKNHLVYVVKCPVHPVGKRCRCDPGTFITERKRVSELQPYEVMLAPDRLPFGSMDMDLGQAYVEGLYASDGWCQTVKNEFCISGQDGCPKEFQKKEVKSICHRLGVRTRWHRKSIAIRDRNWTIRISEMGHYAPEKRILSINLKEQAAAETLRGIMADSGANTSGPGRTFTSTSKKLAVQTRVLHKMFGTTCGSAYIENHGGLGLNPIWRLFVRVNKRADGVRTKLLRVKKILKSIGQAPCYDIQTSDHYVYLPEYDVTVSNCDDLVTALGSALMSIGIPVMVVGQSFKGTDSPTHVILSIETPFGTKRIDPSSSTFAVGEFFPAVKEWSLDPMDTAPMKLSGPLAGDYVGVGRPPMGLGASPASDSIVSQLQSLIFALESARTNLETSLNAVQQTRTLLRPEAIYDPEPAGITITSIADFPTNGVWTKSMADVSTSIWTTTDKLIKAGHEALDGVRKIYADDKDAYIGKKPGDTWSMHTLLTSVEDALIAVYDAAGTIIGGFFAKSGQTLTADEVHAQVQSAAVPAPQGVGVVAPAVIVVGEVVIALVFASLAACYLYPKYCVASANAADQANMKTILELVASGKLTSKDARDLIDASNKARREQTDALKGDPWSAGLSGLKSIVMWVAIGGIGYVGARALTPILQEAAESHRAHRLHA